MNKFAKELERTIRKAKEESELGEVEAKRRRRAREVRKRLIILSVKRLPIPICLFFVLGHLVWGASIIPTWLATVALIGCIPLALIGLIVGSILEKTWW